MTKYSHHTYKLIVQFGNSYHRWTLIGQHFGLDFHISIPNKKVSYLPTAGLEIHSYTGEGAPSHVDCPLTGGRCWHDGTSHYATETLWPMIQIYLKDGDHLKIFNLLESEADSRDNHQAQRRADETL